MFMLAVLRVSQGLSGQGISLRQRKRHSGFVLVLSRICPESFWYSRTSRKDSRQAGMTTIGTEFVVNNGLEKMRYTSWVGGIEVAGYQPADSRTAAMTALKQFAILIETGILLKSSKKIENRTLPYPAEVII